MLPSFRAGDETTKKLRYAFIYQDTVTDGPTAYSSCSRRSLESCEDSQSHPAVTMALCPQQHPLLDGPGYEPGLPGCLRSVPGGSSRGLAYHCRSHQPLADSTSDSASLVDRQDAGRLNCRHGLHCPCGTGFRNRWPGRARCPA